MKQNNRYKKLYVAENKKSLIIEILSIKKEKQKQ